MEEEGNAMGMNLDQFNSFWSEFAKFRERAEKVAQAIENHPCDFAGIDEDGRIRYSYWDGCNCHGGTSYGSFPAEFLFDENWIEDHLKEVEEKKRQEQENKAKAEAEQTRAREEADRKEFERLKKKYEKQ